MSLEQRIMTDLKAAMKAKDQAALRAIRAIKAAILVRKTDGSGKPIDEAEEIKLLQKLVKSRRESLDIYEKQNRADLARIEAEEISVLETYLPAQMDPAQVKEVVRGIIDSMGATSMKDMGKVMGAASKQLAGQADGKLIASLVKEILSSS